MKHLLLSIFSLLLIGNILAQPSLSLYPEDLTFTLEADMDDLWAEPVAHSFVVNTSNQTIALRWEIEIIGTDCPTVWKYKVCDKNQCYNSNVTTNINYGGQPNVPVILAPGDSSIIDIHVNPSGIPGCCKARVTLSDVMDYDNPVDIMAPEYEFCVTAISGISSVQKLSPKVYPNPSADFITLTNDDAVKQLWVTNILGRRVKSFNTSVNGKYDISRLPSGIYLVSMVDANHKIIKTVRISKTDMRP